MAVLPFFILIDAAEEDLGVMEMPVTGNNALKSEGDVMDLIFSGCVYGPIVKVLRIDMAAQEVTDETEKIAERVMANIDGRNERHLIEAIPFVERHLPFVWTGSCWMRKEAARDWTRVLRRGDLVYQEAVG